MRRVLCGKLPLTTIIQQMDGHDMSGKASSKKPGQIPQKVNINHTLIVFAFYCFFLSPLTFLAFLRLGWKYCLAALGCYAMFSSLLILWILMASPVPPRSVLLMVWLSFQAIMAVWLYISCCKYNTRLAEQTEEQHNDTDWWVE